MEFTFAVIFIAIAVVITIVDLYFVALPADTDRSY